MLRSLVFSFVLLAAVFGENPKNPTDLSEKSLMSMMYKVFEHATPCAKEYELTEEDIHAFKQLEFPAGEHNKCFAKCLFNSLGMMKGDKYTPVPASKNIDDLLENKKDAELVSRFLMSCEPVNDLDVSDGDKGCDRAFYLTQCLKENAPKHGIKFTTN